MTYEQNNSLIIIGEVIDEYTFSHKIYGEGFYSFFIKTPRLSDNCDILPVTVSERLILENESLLDIGNKLYINGQIRSYNDFSGTKNKLILTVFAKEITYVGEENNFISIPNQVILNGFLCKKPIYRTTPFGREITDILLAVNRSYNKSDYIPCIAWGRNAKFLNTLEVGDNIKINGRMQSRQYQKKYDNGIIENKTAYEISISKMELIAKTQKKSE